MSISRFTTTVLHCDMEGCESEHLWPVYVSKGTAEALVRRVGWRKDKLNRNICGAHPKLKGARR